MSPDPDDKRRPSFIRHPIAFVRAWLRATSTNLSAGMIALVSIFIGSLLTAAGGFLLNALGSSGNIPGYVALIIGGCCLAIGLAIAWALTRQYYELLLRTVNAEKESATVRATSLEERLAKVEPSDDTLRRFRNYSEHVYQLVATIASGKISLADLQNDDVRRSICELTQDYLDKSASADFKVSIWCEPNESTVNRISGAVADRVPTSVSDLVPGKVKFEILVAPEHTTKETEAFAVPIDPSWIKHEQRREDGGDTDAVYSAEAPYWSALRGDDIEAFTENGYKAVRVVSFVRDGMRGYLVVLSDSPHAFSQAEDQYFLWLRRVLELDFLIGGNGSAD